MAPEAPLGTAPRSITLLQEAREPAKPVLHHPGQNGLFGSDRGSRERNVGQSAPSAPRRCMWDKAFRWGRGAPPPGQASPPTGSPANGPICRSAISGGSAGDGVLVQREPATARPHRVDRRSQSTRRWRSPAAPPGSPAAVRRKARSARSVSRPARSAPAGAGRRFGVVARPLVPGRTAAPGRRTGSRRTRDRSRRMCALESADAVGRLPTKCPSRGLCPMPGAGFHVSGLYRE